jgi:dTMP kinase
MQLRPGILIAIEGIDGAGKTTQVARLHDLLLSAGFDVVRTKEPTNGPWGTRLRESAAAGRLEVEEELDLFLRDRQEHSERLLAPAVEAGKIVLVDRYFGSSAAYQGNRGVGTAAEVLALNEARFLLPDLMLLLEVEPEQGIERIRARGDVPNEFESLDGLRAVQAGFAELDAPYLRRIDGRGSVEEVGQAMAQEILLGPLFDRLCRKPGLAACEPEWCSERIEGRCSYPGAHGVLEPVDHSDLLAALGEPGMNDAERLERLVVL